MCGPKLNFKETAITFTFDIETWFKVVQDTVGIKMWIKLHNKFKYFRIFKILQYLSKKQL